MWSAKRETTRKKAPSSSSSSSSKSSRNNREYSRNHRIIERIIISFCQSNDDGLDFTWTFESLKQLMSAEFSFQSSPARPGERERVLVVFHSVVVVVVVVFLVFVLVVFRPMRSSSFGIERPLAALLIQRRFPDVVERPHLVLVVLFSIVVYDSKRRQQIVVVVSFGWWWWWWSSSSFRSFFRFRWVVRFQCYSGEYIVLGNNNVSRILSSRSSTK